MAQYIASYRISKTLNGVQTCAKVSVRTLH